jgi:hypothetical protein
VDGRNATPGGGQEAVELKRTTGHRVFGAFMVALLGGLAVGGPVAAVGMVIKLGGRLDGAQWFALVLFLLLPVIVWRRVSAAYRLARAPAGTVELSEDALVINDRGLFRAPVHIARSDIVSVAPAPSGTFAFGAWGEAAKADAALVSSYAVKPDVLVRFVRARTIPEALHSGGLAGPYALRPPSPKKPTRGLWLPTRTKDDAARILDWFERGARPDSPRT